MALRIRLPYGKTFLEFECRSRPDMFLVREPGPGIDPGTFRKRLDHFLETTAPDLRQTVLVVADQTRLCGYSQYLPVLVDALLAAGLDPARLTIHIAYGTHAHQSDTQSRRAYGDTYDRFHWVHHQSTDQSLFIELGRTRRGTPVRMRRDIMASGCVITFGAIVHHYFAGFGGGRKLIFPGLGEKSAIHANHGLLLDRAARSLAAGCQPGRTVGNPLAEDLAEYEAFRPADLSVHGILNSSGQVCDLKVGRGGDHFRAACAQHARACAVQGGPYDLVLAACGGYPKDINMIQSHKAIHNAAAFVRDEGRLIVLAHCPGGVGSDTFLPWFAMGSWDAAFDRLADHYVGNGGTALAMMAKLKRIRIGVVTTLGEEVAGIIGFERLTRAQAFREVAAYPGRLAVIPNASLVVRETEGAP